LSDRVAELSNIFALAAKYGQTIARLRHGDIVLDLIPRDLPAKIDEKAPKELPESFEDLTVPNWLDPADQKDTTENRKRAIAAQEAADKEVFGESIPTPDQ
jgi:hypothetical protein